MGRAPIDVSSKVAGLLREKRRELGFTLRQVEERAAELGVRLPTSTLVRIEQGKLDPGVRRLFTLIHVYNVEVLADAMELGALAGGRSPGGNLEELSDRGERAWKAGDIAQALAHALAVREHQAKDAKTEALKQRALVSFATYARNLGKYRLARQIVDDLLRQKLGYPMLVDTLVLAASIWRGLGSLEVALALVERAAKRADAKDLVRTGFVEHQWAKLLLDAGEKAQAERHLDRALELYRRGKDPFNEVRALQLRIKVLEAFERRDAALTCARDMVALAEKRDYGALVGSGRLDLGRLLQQRGEHEEALEELRRALASAITLGDRRVQLLAHARLWKTYQALGEDRAASIELQHAAELAGSVDEVSDLVNEVRGSARSKVGRKAAVKSPTARRSRTRRAVN